MLPVRPQVREDFDILEFNKMCWTLCSKKSIRLTHLRISEDDAFKVWCIFNFLSEDRYPLVIVSEEVRTEPAAVSCPPPRLHAFVCLDRVLPAEADGGRGGRMERGDLLGRQEQLPDGLGAGGAGGGGLL